MDAFAWTVIGSAAGVVSAAVAIVFGLIPLLRDRRERAEISPVPGTAEGVAVTAAGAEVPVVVGEIPQEPVAFQPRAGLLALLDEDPRSGRVAVVRAVTGMRGVGKTHLAAEYARTKLADGWRLVAWINAETGDGLLAGLAEVAGALSLATGDREESGRAVRHWLETGGQQCLLVFDNASDPAVLRPYVPAAGAARVIITSNEQSMGDLGTSVPLEVFTEPEALELLAQRTGSDDLRGARLVAAELGYLPLALAQAAAVIAGQRLQYRTYLERLRAQSAGEVLRPEEAGQYPRGVAATILLSVEAVRTVDDTGPAAGVMELLAVLSPAGVRRTMLHAAGWHGVLGQTRQAPDVVDRALARLSGASLLTFSIDGSAVSAHRLVMRAIREQAAARDALAGICASAAGLLGELPESLLDIWHVDRGAARDLVEQVMALYSVSTAYPDEEDLTRQLFRLRWWAVAFLTYLGDSTARSIGIAEPLLADQERALGADHPDTLATRNHLANGYYAAGRIAEAVTFHEQNLASKERAMGSDHPDTLAIRGNLGLAYKAAGRIAEAITLHEKNLPASERVMGSDHSDTVIARGYLGRAYQAAGRTADAITLHEKNLPDCERVLGSDHPYTLQERGYLAVAYQTTGRVAKAITLLDQILADCQRVLGADHPDTLQARDNLANAYQDGGRTAEAKALHERNLADRERVLGPDHLDTLRTRSKLANANLAGPAK